MTQQLLVELTDMAEKAPAIQEQEYKAAGVTRTKMEEAGDFSKKAKVSRQRLLEV